MNCLLYSSPPHEQARLPRGGSRRLYKVTLPFLSLPGVFLLTGCSVLTTSAIPDTPAQVTPAAIQGSDFGGQAPISSSHLFVLEAEASSNGYGGKATSLLTSDDPGVTQDLTGSAATNPTYGMYYITTGSDGSFNITGDYTCAAGRPVYLYAQGGNSLPAQAPATSAITKVVVGDTGASTSFEFTTATSENFYVGESVALSGFTGTDFAAEINGQSATVLTVGLTMTTFEVDLADEGADKINQGTYTKTNFGTAGIVTATSSPVNYQIVNLAMLGLCPGESGEFANTLSYVYMNEISTVAMAYAMGGFATNPTTGVVQDATHIGSTATNLLGLQNAALNAGQLYDIQGGNVSSGGISHIGRQYTAAGNGIVPQALLSTLGNILAACVNSQNTYNPYLETPTGTQSTQCSELFSNATTIGGATGGAASLDTATAMFNMAHLPAGATASSISFMRTLYALQGANAPYSPALTAQPNDFTVAIQYPLSSNPAVSQAESLGIDANGNVWITSNGNNNIFEMSPQGVVLYQSPSAGYNYGDLSIDPSGNVWVGGSTGESAETKFVVTESGSTQTVTPTSYASPNVGGLFGDANATVTDSSGNAYIAASSTVQGLMSEVQLTKLNNTGGNITGSPFNLSSIFQMGAQAEHGVVENVSTGGDVWLTSSSSIVRLDPATGAVARGFPVNTSVNHGSMGVSEPQMSSVDASSNLWVASQNGGSGGSLTKITAAGATSTATGGTFDGPYGSAVDGLGNVWVANRSQNGSGSSLMEFSGVAGTAISPTTNYTLGGQVSHPLNIAIDPAGALWSTSVDSSMVVEMFGPAAPVATPLSYASGQNELGSRP